MRHKNSGRKFSRTWEHRKAMFRNMACSLFTHERIQTTEAKAKELRKVAEKLITLAQRQDLHSRRQAFQVLANHTLVKKLFDDIGPRFEGVPGGYTRIVKLGLPRLGDCAPMAIIELTRRADWVATPEADKTTAAAPAPEAAAAAPVAEVAPVVAAEPVVEAAAEAAEPEAKAQDTTAEAQPDKPEA